jgi:hypothetical protein
MVLLVVSITAVAAAIGAIACAWRIASTDRLRSDARVAALSAAIDGTSVDATVPMFERAPRSGLQGRPLLKIGVGFAMAVVIIILIAMSGDRHTATANDRPSTASHTPATATEKSAPALELLSMRHVRMGDRLTVTGLVRNQRAASTSPILAEVFVFDRDGGFVASGRAPLEFGLAARGEESPFTVTIPDVTDVGKYRVRFRTEAGVVPHVDRRATLQVSN